MDIDTLKQKIANIESELKKIEASFNQLAGAKMMLEGLINEMSVRPVAAPSPEKEPAFMASNEIAS